MWPLSVSCGNEVGPEEQGQGVGEPVPAAGGFDHRPVGPGEGGEVALEAERGTRDSGLGPV